MNHIPYILLILLSCNITMAGDDASGPIPYSTDLSQPFSIYVMTEKDKKWSTSLAKKFKYNGKVFYFVKTSLLLKIEGSIVNGAIYQAIDNPNVFYIVNGDAILKIGEKLPYSPGSGGFSMHAKKSRNFIMCLNCQTGGVDILSGTKVKKGKVSWKGSNFSRFK